MAKISKKWQKINSEVDFLKTYSVQDAVEILKKYVSPRFDESLDFSVRLGVDPRHADQMVKGVCNLPHGLGKTVRVAVFARGKLAEDAKEAGADIVGAEDLMKEILDGKIDFDRCIASPDMMPIVGRLGKVLGPRNLMPNPKTGTVTTDIKRAVEEVKAGSVEFKCEKAGIVHAGLGKISFSSEKLVENISSFVSSIVKAKPTGAKGNYIIKTTLSTTQGIGLTVDVKEFLS
jgi:large subunit ribosomal protein L1